MACEAGDGAGARRDHGDRGRMSRAWRGGWPGRPWAPARRSEATHSGAPGPDGLGAGGRGGRAASRLRDLWTSAGQQGPLPCDVPVRVRRLLVCPCHGRGAPKSFAALDLGAGPAPELAYVTAKFAALAPFGKVAALLSELLPLSGAQNAGTVRNRALRVGQEVVPQHPTKNAEPPAAPADGPVVVGLDGGYVRSRHRQEERHFEVVAGKVIDARGAQHRFAFARNGPATASEAFTQALATAGVQADTPATVLCDGDAGLWRLQREALPGAT